MAVLAIEEGLDVFAELTDEYGGRLFLSKDLSTHNVVLAVWTAPPLFRGGCFKLTPERAADLRDALDAFVTGTETQTKA